MALIRKFARIIIPSSWIRKHLNNFLNPIFESFLILDSLKKQKLALKKVKRKNKINVVFFVIHRSVWKYDFLYQRFEKEERFTPLIVVCPYTFYGEQIMIEEMENTYNYFFSKKYKVIKAYEKDKKEWLDVKSKIKPDIIFFTNPHNLTNPEYYITHYREFLTCYVQYSFHITHLNSEQYNQLFHNLLWKAFYETPIHLDLAKQYSRNKGKNVIITGYPGTDVFLDRKYESFDNWKIKNREVKRIIWAPHHSIEAGSPLSYSTFLKYYLEMLNITKKYNDSIQISFKPHPILKPKLYNHEGWGKEKTDWYFSEWNNLENGQVEEGDYVDLFINSDSLIFDSASFMTEYLYLNKPALFIINDINIKERFNIFGKMVFENLYHGNDISEIEKFVIDVVQNGKDDLRKKREQFLKTYLLPPNRTSATENIFNEILKYL